MTPRWIFTHEYSNCKYLSDYLRDGYSTFEYQTSICQAPRWRFDIRISNVHLATSQMDIRYSNVTHPSHQLPDVYSITF